MKGISLSAGLAQYSGWRSQVQSAVAEYRDWLRAENLSDLQTHSQLRRRVESVKRIHNAADTVDERLQELELNKAGISDQRDEMRKLSDQVRLSLYSKPGTDNATDEIRNSANTRSTSATQPQDRANSNAVKGNEPEFVVAEVKAN